MSKTKVNIISSSYSLEDKHIIDIIEDIPLKEYLPGFSLSIKAYDIGMFADNIDPIDSYLFLVFDNGTVKIPVEIVKKNCFGIRVDIRVGDITVKYINKDIGFKYLMHHLEDYILKLSYNLNNSLFSRVWEKVENDGYVYGKRQLFKYTINNNISIFIFEDSDTGPVFYYAIHINKGGNFTSLKSVNYNSINDAVKQAELFINTVEKR